MPFTESDPNNYNFITETPDDQEMQNRDSFWTKAAGCSFFSPRSDLWQATDIFNRKRRLPVEQEPIDPRHDLRRAVGRYKG